MAQAPERIGETFGIDFLPGPGGELMSSAHPPGPSDGHMALTLILFFGSAVAIYLSCEFFVNGVEWVGQRLKITQTATGTILAACAPCRQRLTYRQGALFSWCKSSSADHNRCIAPLHLWGAGVPRG